MKYISDAFEEHGEVFLVEWGVAKAEDRDEYTTENIIWVAPDAR